MSALTKAQRLQALRQVGSPYTVHRPAASTYVRHNKPRPRSRRRGVQHEVWQDIAFVAVLAILVATLMFV